LFRGQEAQQRIAEATREEESWGKEFSEIVVAEIKDGVYCNIGVKGGLAKKICIRTKGYVHEGGNAVLFANR